MTTVTEMDPNTYIAHILVEQALRANATPRVHPNGFIQIPLDIAWDEVDGQEQRLHVWPEPAVMTMRGIEKQKTDSPIHDHRFDMHSRVLKGALRQQLYSFQLEHFGDPTHEIYMANYSSKDQSTLEPTGVLGKFGREPYYFDYPAGQTYTQQAFTFHESIPTIFPVVTLMTKTKTYEGEPRVLCPIGEPPDNEFDRLDFNTDTLWQIVEDAIR